MAAVLMLPFIIRVVASSLSNFDFAIEEAALSLGAGRFATFFKVVLPNIRSGCTLKNSQHAHEVSTLAIGVRVLLALIRHMRDDAF